MLKIAQLYIEDTSRHPLYHVSHQQPFIVYMITKIDDDKIYYNYWSHGQPYKEVVSLNTFESWIEQKYIVQI